MPGSDGVVGTAVLTGAEVFTGVVVLMGAGEDAAVDTGAAANAQESATRTGSGGKFIGILSELYKQR